MTVCYGPSTESLIFSLIVSIIVPILIIFLMHKFWKPEKKLLSIILYVVVFIVLFVGLSISLFNYFTPPCGPGIAYFQFSFNPADNSCIYDSKTISSPEKCLELQETYITQRNSGQDYCPEGSIANLF